jgi:hypothetical protein
VLEKKMFERALDFFFHDHNGHYVLDGGLIGSTVGDRNEGIFFANL